MPTLVRILPILSLFVSISSQAMIGFRWGGPTDDSILTSLARASGNEYELTEANVKSAVMNDVAHNWQKSSGSGIFYSSDLSDSFSDGRVELFLFDTGNTPIEDGAIGSVSRDYYTGASSTLPPFIAKYNPTWYVIARAPSESEGIKFHRAEARDSLFICKYFKQKYPNSADFKIFIDRTTKTFNYRLSDSSYSIPTATRGFINTFMTNCK